MLKTIIKCWRPNPLVRCYAKKVEEMKYLNVAEKNDAAKTIAGLLSRGSARRREGYSVYNKIYEFEANVKGQQSKMIMTSVSGHLLSLEFFSAYRKWDTVNPEALFSAPVRKSCPEDYQPIKRTLEREIRSCQGLIIWTDCDREGENIGFEIIDVCRAVKPNIRVYRATFSEITTAAVQRALQRLGEPDKRLSDAVDVRTELDLRTGAAITRFQTMRLQRLFPTKIASKLISYGSCQIPTLGFVAERYKEIEAFVSEPFWKLKITHTIDDLTVDFNWARNRLFDKAACEDFLLLCLSDPKATVEEVTVKPKSKWRPTPLDTVEMEKLGSRKLKLSAKDTMAIAEKLYTKGIISYPRTETNQFSKEIDLRALVEQQSGHAVWGSFAQRVIEWGPNPRNGNKSDQAHPPIHPTKLVTDLQGNEARVYELICRHFLACVSKDAVGSETVVRVNIAGEKFTATGLCIHERNYLDVYIYDKWNAKQIHKYEQDQIFEPTEISMQEGATTAPPLLTEADLIALMEKHGIGTDATHAEHINTIKERGYIGVVDKGSLVPGIIGMGLYEGYDAMELALAKPMLRAEFEADLKKICLGAKDPKLVLREQIEKYKAAYKQIMEKITAMDDKLAQRLNETPVVDANASTANTENGGSQLQELFQCPKCTVAPLALRPKKNQTGFYIGCMNFPDCKNAIWLPDECKEPSVLSGTCPRCGPSVKLLKFKFSTTYYKNLFNAPFGWYKTCLQCDAQFRETFNINLDSVKRVGAIAGDAPTTTTTATGTKTATGTSTLTRTRTVTVTRSANNSNTGATNHSQVGERGTNMQTDKHKKKTPKTNQQSIRGFCNANSASVRIQAAPAPNSLVTEEQVPATQLNDIPLDEFFDSNDGFDDIMRTIETTNVVRENTNISVASSTSRSTSANISANFDDSFSRFLRDADDDLDEFVWGTAAHNQRTLNNTNMPSAKKPCLHVQEPVTKTITNWGLSSPRNVSQIQCTGCHQTAKELTVKKDGPNKGRQFYVCPKQNACKFFQWADGDSVNDLALNNASPTSKHIAAPQPAPSLTDTSVWGTGFNSATTRVRSTLSTAADDEWDSAQNVTINDSNFMKCGCNIPLSRLIVRKDGPNKGRHFYACPNRDKPCGFFQWDDEDNNQASTSTGIRNQSNQLPRSGYQGNPRNSQDTQKEIRKRKCGLCRQFGHTKQKCPRKSEFEY